jgi:dipeptidyl aminopeptidase/acylaminoacyl peptidase
MAATPPPLAAYGALPAIEDMAISPSGKLAMLATSQGKRVLVVLDASFKPVSISDVGDIKVRDIEWIGDEAIMLERSDTQALGDRFIAQQGEFFNAMIIPADGKSPVRTVFADDKNILNAIFGSHGFRKLDGKWTGLFVGRNMTLGQGAHYYFDPDYSNVSLYAVDVATNKARPLAGGPGKGESGDWLVDAKGQVQAMLTMTESNGYWRIEDPQHHQLAAGTALHGGASILGFNHDGSGLVYRISPDKGEPSYYEVALAGRTQPKQVFKGIDIDSFFIHPDTERLLGYRPKGVGKDGAPVFFDAKEQETVGKVLTAFAPAGGELRDLTPDYSRILIETAGNNDSGTWYLVDTKAGQSQVIGKARPQIGANDVGPVSRIKYKAQDGLEIEAILTLPPGLKAQGLPLVVLPHGGPRAADDLTFDWWAQAFASRGYAVLQPNFRGSTGYGDKFLHAGDNEWGRKMQTDLSDGIAYLAGQGTVDPKRACIVGGSYGGYAALAGVTLQKGVYRCAVSVAGVSDLKLMLDQDYRESGSTELKSYWLELMGPRDQLDKYSPRMHGADANAPILLIHGRDDTVVPYVQSQKMADALKDAGKPFEFVDLKHEDHWLSGSDTRQQMLEAAVAFVQKNNPAG